MKRLLLAVLMVLFTASLSFGGQKTINGTWEQVLPSPNDMKEWRLYKCPTTGCQPVAANLFATIPFVSQQTTYTTTQVLTSPDNQRVQYFFVLVAIDTSGNVSGPSNEANIWIDFEKPSTPTNFQLTIQVVTP